MSKRSRQRAARKESPQQQASREQAMARHRSGLVQRESREHPIALLVWAMIWVVAAVALVIVSCRRLGLPFVSLDEVRTTLRVFAGFFAVFAVLQLLASLRNRDVIRRSRSRSAIRAAQAPTPANDTSPRPGRASRVPELQVGRPMLRRLDQPPRRVSDRANVVGLPPADIVFLRLFDNEAGSRRFMAGAWREFGQVTLLKTSESLTRAELRSADQLLVGNAEQLERVLYRPRPAALPPGRHQVTDGVGTLSVRDRYGSYPVRSLLCTNAFWFTAVETLVRRADLIVLDLSGFTDRSAGTLRELRLVVDRIPIRRVLVLRDRTSNVQYLAESIRWVWRQMVAGSPNASGSRSFVNLAPGHPYTLSSSTYSRRLATNALDLAAGRLVFPDDPG